MKRCFLSIPAALIFLNPAAAAQRPPQQVQDDTLTPVYGGPGAPFAGAPADAMTVLGRPQSARAADTINAADSGVKCDGATLDSAAMQTAINLAESVHKRLDVPGGLCLVNGLLINTALTIRGQGDAATTFYSPTGSNKPTITVAVATAYSPGGVTTTTVELSGLRISGSAGDTANRTTAHGIAFLDSGAHIQTRLKLTGDFIEGVAGDGVHGEVNPSSWVDATGTFVQYSGNNGLYANSVADWKWIGGSINGSALDNLVLSGVGEMHFDVVDIYTAKHNNVSLYGITQGVRFIDCHLDLAGWHGVYNAMSSVGWASFSETAFRWSSQATNATYYDIYSDAGSAGTIYLTADRFTAAATNSFSSNNVLANIGFNGTSTTKVTTDIATVFDAGLPTAAGAVTNNPAQIIGQVASGLGTAGAAVINLHANANAAYMAPAAANGGTVTMAAGQQQLMLLPSATLSTFTVNLPPTPQDGQRVQISSAYAITTLTVVASGKTMFAGSGTISLSANQGVEYTYVAGGSSWVKSF